MMRSRARCVQYDDGDTEDVTLRDLRALLPRDPTRRDATGGSGDLSLSDDAEEETSEADDGEHAGHVAT